ncbi:MAG TPA: sigma-54-dependent Fis family transcriptional regulator, partial [Myxococcota bacterium]
MVGRDDDTTMGPSASRTRTPPRPTLRVVFSGERPCSELHPLRSGATPMGRGVDSVLGIKLADARASREHAVITLAGERARIRNKSQHGTQINGAPVDEAPLHDGDVLQLGDTFAVFRMVPVDVVDVASKALIGWSPQAARLRATVRLVGPTRASVLLLGPTGAGKDVMARALHDESGRKGALVAVNSTAISEALAESQLFGHVAGSFTGAKADHVGWFRQADSGTLFLDEVGDLPLSLQPKLLRVLDEQRVLPVGAAQSVAVDVRVIAATNADLEARVHDGRFRADLFARLAEIAVVLPPLAARKEDVLALLEHALPKDHAPLEPLLVAALLRHGWPYNVREVVKVAGELAVR